MLSRMEVAVLVSLGVLAEFDGKSNAGLLAAFDAATSARGEGPLHRFERLIKLCKAPVQQQRGGAGASPGGTSPAAGEATSDRTALFAVAGAALYLLNSIIVGPDKLPSSAEQRTALRVECLQFGLAATIKRLQSQPGSASDKRLVEEMHAFVDQSHIDEEPPVRSLQSACSVIRFSSSSSASGSSSGAPPDLIHSTSSFSEPIGELLRKRSSLRVPSPSPRKLSSTRSPWQRSVSMLSAVGRMPTGGAPLLARRPSAHHRTQDDLGDDDGASSLYEGEDDEGDEEGGEAAKEVADEEDVRRTWDHVTLLVRELEEKPVDVDVMGLKAKDDFIHSKLQFILPELARLSELGLEMLLDRGGLDALAEPAFGHAIQYGDVDAMKAVLHVVFYLLEQLEDATKQALTFAQLPSIQNSHEEGAMLRALVRCIEPEREVAVTLELDYLTILTSFVVSASAAAYGALLRAFSEEAGHKQVDGVAGVSARFTKLVAMCLPKSLKEGAGATTDGGDPSDAELKVAAAALRLLNGIIGKPQDRGARQARRYECIELGLLKTLASLQALRHQRRRSQRQLPADLADEIDTYHREELHDDEATLEGFEGKCVLLYTSQSVQRKAKADCLKVYRVLAEENVCKEPVGFVYVDGALTERKKARDAFWAIAGQRSYPQVFINNTYVGGKDRIVALNDEGADAFRAVFGGASGGPLGQEPNLIFLPDDPQTPRDTMVLYSLDRPVPEHERVDERATTYEGGMHRPVSAAI